MAWELANNQTKPDDKFVLHARGCRSKLCCNPSHLRLGSPQENIEDAKAEGIRLGSKLKPAQVLEIVALKRKHGIKNWVLAERFSAGDTPCHFQLA